MSMRHMPLKKILITGLTAVAIIATCVTFTSAEATERESLKEPVYRVSKSNDLVSAPAAAAADAEANQAVGVRPVIDHQAAAAPLAPQSKDPCECPELLPESASTETAKAAPATSREIMNQAIADAHKILAHIQAEVDDYTCTFIKRENVNGKVLPPECIRTKVRNRKVVNGETVVPFSVYMKFVKPKSVQGREIVYVEGVHNNQVFAKEGGTAGRFLPAVWLNTTSRFAMKSNRYPVTELGVENLAKRLIERAQADIDFVDDCDISYVSGAKVGGRPCKVLTVRRDKPKTGAAANRGMNVNLAMVFIDEELNIPIRYGAYDWPVGSQSQGDVIEEYTYHNLKTNVGLTDADFDPNNPKYNFK